MAEENYEVMGPVFGDAPVPLVVELGRIDAHRWSRGLQIGQVLSLMRSPQEQLDLVVNEQVLGRGELVEVNGRIGIRIVSLNL